MRAAFPILWCPNEADLYPLGTSHQLPQTALARRTKSQLNTTDWKAVERHRDHVLETSLGRVEKKSKMAGRILSTQTDRQARRKMSLDWLAAKCTKSLQLDCTLLVLAVSVWSRGVRNDSWDSRAREREKRKQVISRQCVVALIENGLQRERQRQSLTGSRGCR